MTQTIFESKGCYTNTAKVQRTSQRKFKVTLVGEETRQTTKAKAIQLATEAALTLNFESDPTMADVEAAEKLTAKMGNRGRVGDLTEIRSGKNLSGKRVRLYREAFGNFFVMIGTGKRAKRVPIRGRDNALEFYAATLTE